MTRTVFFIFFAVFLCLVSVATTAKAQSSRLYFAGYLGLNTHGDNEFDESSVPVSGDLEMKNAFSLAGALGLRINNNMRFEGEISYRNADMDRVDFDQGGSFKLGGDLTTWLYMVNFYYDFDFEWQYIRPFVTAGVGVAFHDGNIDDVSGLALDTSDDSLDFAWQVGGGLKYRVRDNMAFTGNYRYLDTTDIGLKSYEIDYGSHEFRLGVEYDIPTDFLQ